MSLDAAAFLDRAVTLWLSGGWAMAALAVNGVVMFGMGMTILSRFSTRGGCRAPDRAWRRFHEHPEQARGTLGNIIAGAVTCRTLKELEHYFDGLRNAEIQPFERDLRAMKVTVSTALLLGLLGTVTGMLSTFRALAEGAGGTETMDLVAGGISEALVTTETGLVLALSGVVFQFILQRKHQGYDEAIAHLETLSMQHLRTAAG